MDHVENPSASMKDMAAFESGRKPLAIDRITITRKTRERLHSPSLEKNSKKPDTGWRNVRVHPEDVMSRVVRLSLVRILAVSPP